MADVTIRGVTYTGVSKLDLDKSGGGSAIYYDTEDADAVASDILTGKKAYGSSGLITGTRQPPSGSISITDNGAVDVTDYATALVNVSGGGGPTAADAVIYVSAPAGATITATKGSVTIVPTLWISSDSNQENALFVIEATDFDSTPWTVTATSGAQTASETVIVSENKSYNVQLSFAVYFIKQGILQDGLATNLYGGGTITVVDGGTGSGYLDYDRTTGGGDNVPRGFYISPSYDFNANGKTTLYIDFVLVSCYTGGYTNRYPTFGIGGTGATFNNLPATYSAYEIMHSGGNISSPTARTTLSCSISVTGDYYPKIVLYNSNSYHAHFQIFNLWAE